MTSFEVSCITSAFAAATSISLEWTIPAVVLRDIANHIFLLIVSAQTILTELLPIKFVYEIYLRACAHFIALVADKD